MTTVWQVTSLRTLYCSFLALGAASGLQEMLPGLELRVLLWLGGDLAPRGGGVGKDSMGFARQAGFAVLLVTMTLLLQSAGMAVLIHWARLSIARGIRGLSPIRAGVLMMRFTTAMLVLHVLQILLWAGFYRWHCLPSWETGFYFSATSYSTVGYGDIVLPRIWRLMGPIESITGVVMCGLSVSALFAILMKLVDAEEQSSPETLSGSVPAREAELTISR